MLPILALPVGFAFGWWRAAKRGGKRLDRLQYAAAHALFFGVVALIGGAILANFIT
ncbi:MAG: hypothetical protein WD046_09530 [Paracoccaceae bacterium]